MINEELAKQIHKIATDKTLKYEEIIEYLEWKIEQIRAKQI